MNTKSRYRPGIRYPWPGQQQYPFNWLHYANLDEAENINGPYYFMVKWLPDSSVDDNGVVHDRIPTMPEIVVRFARGTWGCMIEQEMSIHYTARNDEGQYQPWCAWDGCCLQGNTKEHARKIWHMIANNAYTPVDIEALNAGNFTTRHKGSVWDHQMRHRQKYYSDLINKNAMPSSSTDYSEILFHSG